MYRKLLHRLFVIIASISLIVACAPPMVLTGVKTESIHPDKVRLYFTQRPECDYDKVGYLRINGGYYSQSSLFRAMQRQAAMVGADGVYVQETHQLDILEFVGTATAIRCSSGEINTYSSSSASS